MIIKKCDICKREVEHIDSIILKNKSFDYCEKCKNKALRIVNEFNKTVEKEKKLYEINLKMQEEKILKKYIKK